MKEPVIIHKSNIMKSIIELVKRVAKSNARVMILGESGTGKELIASTIHYYSNRRDKNFVPINCAAINENLLESELFGHEKGAYTSAYNMKVGKFEFANEGTLFLDEIGDMPLSMQSKILRVTQTHSFERVGSNQAIKIDTRIITATNKNLIKKINNVTFREDLYYRLAVIIITLPALRERKVDIIPLVEFFIGKYNKKLGKDIKALSNSGIKKLKEYPWPGNIRELENVIERAILLSNSHIIDSEAIAMNAPMVSKELIDIPIGGIDLDGTERSLIVHALKKSNGRQDIAAKKLGISSRVINYKIHQKHKIFPKEYFC